MNTVQISHGSVDKRLEGGRGDALENSCSHHAPVVVLALGRAAPGRRHNQQEGPADKQMALPPDATRGHKYEGADADAQQVPARQVGDLGEGRDVVKTQGQRVCGENGAEACGEDGDHGEDEGDEVALPKWPVLEVHLLGRVPRNHIQSEKGQRTNGSLGSSLGCGTSTMGTGPERSYLSPGVSSSGCR